MEEKDEKKKKIRMKKGKREGEKNPGMETSCMELSVAPLFGLTRLAGPNWIQNAHLIICIYFLFIYFLSIFFSKVSQRESPVRPEWRIRTGAWLLIPFSFILSKHFNYVILFYSFQLRESCFKW